MQEEEGGNDAAEAERVPLAKIAFAALPVHAGVESKPQAKEGTHVLQEAGKRCSVNVNPLWPFTPSLGFL